jgi:glucose-1-phosphate cytidylyltransferase
MKAVILAGGLGTRISEESHLKPKPMIEIGGKPILWHVMKIYSHYGINDFIICLGYKGYVIKEYFASYSLHMSDVTFLPVSLETSREKCGRLWCCRQGKYDTQLRRGQARSTVNGVRCRSCQARKIHAR